MSDLATFKADKRAQRTTDPVVKANHSLSDQASDEAKNLMISYIEECKSLIANNPSYNNVTKENRKWAGAKSMYGGSVLQAVHELFTGIQRSSADYKTMLLAKVGLSENLIDRVVASFGRTANFYNEVYQDEVEADLDTLNVSLDMVEDHFDIYIDRASITPLVVRNTFSRNKDAAIIKLNDHLRTIATREQSELLNAQKMSELAV